MRAHRHAMNGLSQSDLLPLLDKVAFLAIAKRSVIVSLTPARLSPTPWRAALWAAIALLLLAPLAAMQFTREVAWTAFDFAFAGVLLIGAGLAVELAVWKLPNRNARLFAAGVILLAVVLTWADGAVGVF